MANSEPGLAEINVRKTHPTLYWILMAIAFVGIGLSLNFFFLRPTFPIWGVPNAIWGAIYLVSSVASIVTLNVYRRLLLLRVTMAFSAFYMGFLAVGTTQPFLEGDANLQFALPVWEGKASLQLPIVYAGLVAIQVRLLWEPFLNPVTAKQ